MVSIELGKLVGKGGFSEVYEGVYRGRRVAVKVLDKTWLSSKRLLGRAREEVRLHLLLSSHLHKPNNHRREHGEKSIVEALDSFEDEDKIYLVLELCEKGNLYSWIKKHRPLEREVVVRWFREIVEAVSFLHANDIVHRDLKLSNILLSDDGHAKVSDFGLATTIEDREHHTVCGTPNYMAPEVRFHDKKSPQGYDPVQADLWSLGCLLFALLHDGKHFDPKSKYKRTERIEDDNAHQLLSTLLNRKQERSSAREILDHPFLRGRRDPEKSKETARMSYVRIDTGLIRGVQHTFGSHKVHITRDGRLFVSVPRKQSDGQQEDAVKQIEVKEWMHAKYNKLQRYCAKAVEILKNATPRVVLRISYPEAVIAAVVGGVGRVWFEQRNLHATYDLSPFDMSPIEEPVVMVGKEKITLEDVRHAPQWVGDLTEVSTVNDSFATRLSQHRTGRTKANLFELVQDLVLRCLEIEEDLHLNRPASGPPVGYPVIVNDDQVSVKGVGVGVRDPQGTVSVCLHDGTHITLEKMGNTIRCDDTSYALFKCPENLHLPLLPPHLRKKLRKAQTILRELATK